MGAVDQARFGSRGIINSTHFYSKSAEFYAWLADVKGISPDAPVPKGELMAYFADYCEDFNTATLPHERFYDLEAFDARARAAGEAGGGGRGGGARAGVMDMLAESQARKQAARDEARSGQAALMAAYRANMDPARRAEVEARAEMQRKMEYLYKAGQTAAAESLKRQLDAK